MTFRLKSRVGPDCACDEQDVMHLKQKLRELGYLPDTELNRTGIPHQEMFDALTQFQKDKGIKEYDL